MQESRPACKRSNTGGRSQNRRRSSDYSAPSERSLAVRSNVRCGDTRSKKQLGDLRRQIEDLRSGDARRCPPPSSGAQILDLTSQVTQLLFRSGVTTPHV